MKLLTTLAAAIVLSACGGGGSDGPVTPTPPPVAAPTAEGFWMGTASTGATLGVAILENGDTWGISSYGGSLTGAFTGNTVSSGTSVSGSGLMFSSVGAQSGTYTGSFVAKSTLNLTISDGTKVAATYSAAYDQPALLSNLAGSYGGYGATGRGSTGYAIATISANGSVSAGDASCGASGSATPRASGKNVFDVRITFNGSGCAIGNGVVTNGIAYYDISSRQVLVLTLNSSKTDGFAFLGKR